MTEIPVILEKSCSDHPLLRDGHNAPRTRNLQIDANLLFSLSTLRYQQSTKGRRSYQETKDLWRNLLGIHRIQLTFLDHEIVANTDGELLTELSEIVGIGCGLAAMLSEFKININRFRRYKGQGQQRRLDFEFYHAQKRFFHETKGTTRNSKISELRNDILDQKMDTKAVCKHKLTGPNLTACTGSIVVYRRSLKNTYNSRVLLLDPPAIEDENGRQPRERDELCSILQYYRNFYHVTHYDPQNVRRQTLSDWLTQVVQQLESGQIAPKQSPVDLFVRGRVVDRSANGPRYWGTFFDARAADVSVRRYPTFRAASRAIEHPTVFVGVSEEVTQFIRECRWEKLMEYETRSSNERGLNEREVVLASGILTKSAELNAIEEQVLATDFSVLRRRAEDQGRILPQ